MQHPGNQIDERINIEWLGKVASGVNRLGFLDNAAVAADDNEWYLPSGSVTLQLVADFLAVLPRHHNIEDNEVGAATLDSKPCLGGIAGHLHAVIRAER